MANQSKIKNVLDLPDLVICKIFMLLGGTSLHVARQVCKDWNNYIVNRIWGLEYNRRIMSNRLENYWRRGDCDVYMKWVDLDNSFTAYVECYASELVAIRSRMGTNLNDCRIQIYNIMDDSFWEVPQPFQLVADRALGNNYRITLTDSLMAIRVQLNTPEQLDNVVVWTLNGLAKFKILDEDIPKLRHVQACKTKKHSDLLVLFTRNYIEIFQYPNPAAYGIARIRVDMLTTAHFDGTFNYPYLMQVFDSPDLAATALTVWTMRKDPLALEQKIVVNDIDDYFHLESGDAIQFPVEDILYLGNGFIISCETPAPGRVDGLNVLTFRICNDSGLIIKQYTLPEFSSDAYVNFYLFEKRLLVSIDDYCLVYKYNTKQLCDPEFTKAIDFHILDDLPGTHEIMLKRTEASSVNIATFYGGMQMLKKKTVEFWKKE